MEKVITTWTVTFVNTDGSTKTIKVNDGDTIPASSVPAIIDSPLYNEYGWTLNDETLVDPVGFKPTGDIAFWVKKDLVVDNLKEHDVVFINTDGAQKIVHLNHGEYVDPSLVPTIVDSSGQGAKRKMPKHKFTAAQILEIKQAHEKEADPHRKRLLHALLLKAEGKSGKEICELTGFKTTSYISSLAAKYLDKGLEAITYNRACSRRYLSVTEEEKFFNENVAPFREKIESSTNDEEIQEFFANIKKKFDETVKHESSSVTFKKMLERHGIVLESRRRYFDAIQQGMEEAGPYDEKDRPFSFRVNSRLLEEVREIYSRYGLSVSDAVTLFFLHSVQLQCFPFDLIGDYKEQVRQQAWLELYRELNEAWQSDPLLKRAAELASLPDVEMPDDKEDFLWL